jgi:hypothetical protein
MRQVATLSPGALAAPHHPRRHLRRAQEETRAHGRGDPHPRGRPQPDRRQGQQHRLPDRSVARSTGLPTLRRRGFAPGGDLLIAPWPSPHHTRRPAKFCRPWVTESQNPGNGLRRLRLCGFSTETSSVAGTAGARSRFFTKHHHRCVAPWRSVRFTPSRDSPHHQYRTPHDPAFCARRDSRRPRPRAGPRRNYHRTRDRGGARRCGSLQPGTGPPRGAGQPAGRSLSRGGRHAAAPPGPGTGGRRHNGRRRGTAGRAPPRQYRHARRLDRERRLRPHCALAPGGSFRPAGLWLQ